VTVIRDGLYERQLVIVPGIISLVVVSRLYTRKERTRSGYGRPSRPRVESLAGMGLRRLLHSKFCSSVGLVFV
jgi:hypothetical protein